MSDAPDKSGSGTRGQALLIEWLNGQPKKGGARRTQAMLAQKLGVGQQIVSAYVRGRSRPGGFRRRLLARVCGIPQDAWLTADERALLSGRAA